MAELAWAAPLDAPALRRAVRARLGELGLRLRVVAEDVLAAESPIDLLTLDPRGGVVLVLVEPEGDGLALVARGLAQRSWVEARLGDWIQLAPRLGIAREAPVRLLLAAPEFGAEARAAAQALGEMVLALVRVRAVRNGGESQVLLEPVRGRGPGPAGAPPSGAPTLSRFRSGLEDADLSVTPEERIDLE